MARRLWWAVAAAVLLGVLAVTGSHPAGAQATPPAPSPADDASIVWTSVAPAFGDCVATNTTVSTAGGPFVPARLVDKVPGTWADGLWLTAQPGVQVGDVLPPSTCGYARWDGQGPEVQRIPQPVQRYVYRIDAGSFSANAAARALEVTLRADNVAKLWVNGQLVGSTPPCDTDGEDLAAPIDCPVANFQGPSTTFRVPASALVGPAAPLVEIEVLDYGSYTGMSYTLRRGEASTPPPPPPPPPDAAACAPSDNASCSLTVTVPKGAAPGTARYCYAPPDDEAREVVIPTATGNVSVVIEANTWVDAPASSTGTIYYPNEFWPVKLSEIGDPALSRCPGAITAG